MAKKTTTKKTTRRTTTKSPGSSNRSVSKKRRQHLTRFVATQRINPNVTVVGLARPAVLVLGAGADEQEDLGSGEAIYHHVE